MDRRGHPADRRNVGGSEGSPTPFSPTSLSGCILWLRADLGITDTGGLIDEWADQSGQGNDFTATAPTRPTLIASHAALNSQPAVDFLDGGANYFNTAMTHAASDYTIVAVVDILSVAADRFLFDTETGRLLLATQRSSKPGYFDAAYRLASSNTVTGAQSLTWSLEASSSGELFRDNASIGGGLSYTQRAIGGAVKLGGVYSTTGDPFNRYLSEFLIYNRVLTSDERAELHTYLAARYGL